MLSVTVHAHISAPREQIYDLLADLSARPAFSDHHVKDFRLANPVPTGKGAAARYKLESPFNTHWVETTIAEAERPHRIVEATHGGRNGRTRGEIAYDLSRVSDTLTRVEMSIISEPGTPREAFKNRFGQRRWLKRQAKTSLERLRMIFEEPPSEPLARATVAGWEPSKGPRFGTSSRPVADPGSRPARG